MILLALAAAAAAQWTGPRTEEYRGPGYFCGGGYAVHLARGDRALILPQDTGGQGARLVLAGREVNVHSGVRPQTGRVVIKYSGSVVTEESDGDGISYVISDGTPFGLRVTSDAFHGFKKDGWFFAKANFANRADETVRCLAAGSY